MKKSSLIHLLIYGNKALVICVLFTLATMLDMILCSVQGIQEISYWHIGMRFVLTVMITLSFYLFKFFEKLPVYAILIMHCGIAVLTILTSVWITSWYTGIHPNAYRDAARTVFIIYPIIILGSIIIDTIRTARANRILKKRFNAKNDV